MCHTPEGIRSLRTHNKTTVDAITLRQAGLLVTESNIRDFVFIQRVLFESVFKEKTFIQRDSFESVPKQKIFILRDSFESVPKTENIYTACFI